MNKTKHVINLLQIFLLFFISISLYVDSSFAKDPKPEKSIVVKDFSWGAGGMGQPAILKEITLKNTGIEEFQNIEIELELYSNTNIPLGSLRSTIHDILSAGSEKTFYNVKFGIMHSDLQKSTARVVRAELIERGTPTHPRNLILVKNWKWSGGQYGTEAILEEITLENKSNNNYKDVKIRVSDLGVSGPKVGPEGYTTNVVIHDILLSKSTRTYENINVGFRHPDATKTSIYVLNAKTVSTKELRYILAEKKKKNGITLSEGTLTTIEKPTRKLSLAERYKKKIEEQKAETESTNNANELDDFVEGSPQETEPTDEKVVSKRSTEDKPVDEGPQIATIDEDEVPLPKYDIVIKDFEWGSGVPGSLGILKKLTLKNKSGINYSKIHLLIEFLSPQGITLASNDLKIYDMLPAKKTREFENLNVGIIVVLPNERNMRISVKDAESLN